VLDDPEIAMAMFGTESLGLRCPEIEPFLRSVLARSRNRDLITYARSYLGGYLAELARMHDRLAAPISGPELTKVLTKDRLDRYRAIDGPKLRGEAEALLEQVVREQGDKPLTLGGQVADELDRIRHLRIGQPAPELIGEDIDGAPIRLSDFRGKVVVLSLWVTSGYPYMPIDQGKDLVAAMKGRPFALVGVNGDAAQDRAKVKEAMTKEGITWRSFWAGGPDGTIPQKWGIDRHGAYGWRTVYTIDANGIIRDDQVGDKLTPAAFESLVQAAEKAAR
jgi:peroxiredoxin